MDKQKKCKLGSVGGQALIEGVMMRSGNKITCAVRKEDKSIVTKNMDVENKSRPKILKLPLIRGIVGFIDSMKIGYDTMMFAASQSMESEEVPTSKFDLWLEKHLGNKVTAVIGTIGSILGVALSIFLFMWLPTFLYNLIPNSTVQGSIVYNLRAVSEGLLRMAIFIGYLALISCLKDIKRVFKYHGAEHKSIFCLENNLELTVENVKKFKRFHPRCGTSFMILMLIISIVISLFITATNPLIRTAIKLACLPIIMGLGYEVLKICGKHDNLFTKIVSAPGLWVQRLTTKEPDDDMIEVAIVALKGVLEEQKEEEKNDI